MSVPERVLSTLRALPGVTEEVLWGNDLVYKVGGKMFAVFGLAPDPASERPDAGGSFKVREEDYEDLAARPGLRPAPYLARAKWIAFDGWRVLPLAELEERLRASYELVRAGLSRRVLASLGGAAKAKTATTKPKAKTVKPKARAKTAEPKPKAKALKSKPKAKAVEPKAKKAAARPTTTKKPRSAARAKPRR